jgi:chitin disaccharide deacetylase
MPIPSNVIANADDFGFNHSINTAILFCFEQHYINSTSIMVNMPFFDEAVNLIHQNDFIRNIGVHVNLAEGKPVTDFKLPEYLDENGNWDFKKVNKKINFLSAEAKTAFSKEIHGQVDKALSNKLLISHIDSHCHLHTLPCFYKLFLDAAQHYKLKIRLAQTYNEGNFVNFYYRKYINNVFKKSNSNYSEYFEDAKHFFGNEGHSRNGVVEIMLHPDYEASGKLSDHFDAAGFESWVDFLSK